MDIDTVALTEQYELVLEFVARFAQYGPFAGILLAMVEAFFPPLPLVVFVTINVLAYGFWQGYLYSFIGTFIGSWLVFLIIRRFGHSRFSRLVHKSRRFDNLLHWIKDQGFVPIFVMLAFPFTPSIVVCGLAGLADVKKDDYFFALFFGKLIMVFSLSFIGYNVGSFISKPYKSFLLILLTVAVSLVGKRIIAWYEKKLEKKRSKKHRKV